MIEIKHGPHKIRYEEESNTWHCIAMKCSAPSLADLRTRLNSADREDRRIGNVRAFSTDRGYSGEETEVIITMIDTGRSGVTGFRVGKEHIKKREYFSLRSLVIINEKNALVIDRYKKAVDALEVAEREMEDARNALPRLTAEEFKAES